MINREICECLIGFDGYIDTLYSVVRSRKDVEHCECYERIEEFGDRILAASHKSADIEICPIRTSLGGNAPIMANAVAALGHSTACIGHMDCGQGEDPFVKMHPACERISIGEVNRTTALEFSDGKIMMGDLRGSGTGWQEIKERVGFDRLMNLAENCRLIGIVNWSGMFRMNEIIDGFFREILLPLQKEGNLKEQSPKDIFLDLADPTARSEEDLEMLFELLRSMTPFCRITLGMNENEALKLGEGLGIASTDKLELGKEIRSALKLYQAVIHTKDGAYGFREEALEKTDNFPMEKPVAVTGAGDHFNAGFCAGMLEEKSLLGCLQSGQAMASFYVRNGLTADRQQLQEYMA